MIGELGMWMALLAVPNLIVWLMVCNDAPERVRDMAVWYRVALLLGLIPPVMLAYVVGVVVLALLGAAWLGLVDLVDALRALVTGQPEPRRRGVAQEARRARSAR